MQIPQIGVKFIVVIVIIIAFFVIFSQVPESNDFEETFEETYYITYSSITVRKLVSSSNSLYEETVSLSANNNRFVLFTVFPDSLSESFSEKQSTSVVKELEKNSVFETRQKTGQSGVSVKFVFNKKPENGSGINIMLAESFVDELSEMQLREFNEKLFALKELELSPVKANRFENEIAKKIVSSYFADLKGKENQDLILFAGSGVPLELFYSILSALEPGEEFAQSAVTDFSETQVPSSVSAKDEWLPLTRTEKRIAFQQEPIQVEIDDYFNPRASVSFMAVNPNDLSYSDLLDDDGYQQLPPFHENIGFGSGNWIEGIPSENYSVRQTPTYEFNPNVSRVTSDHANVLDKLAGLNSEGRLKGNFEGYLTAAELRVFDSMVDKGIILENEPYKVDVDFDFTPYLEQHIRIPERFEGTLSTTYTPLLGGISVYPVEVNVEQIDSDVILVTLGGQLEKDPNYETALEEYSVALEAKGLEVAYYELDDPIISKLFVDNDFSQFIGNNPNLEPTETHSFSEAGEIHLANGNVLVLNDLDTDTGNYAYYVKSGTVEPGVYSDAGLSEVSSSRFDSETGIVTFEVDNHKTNPQEFRQTQVAKTKDVVDVLRIHTTPDYLLILGGDNVIPMAEVNVFDIGDDSFFSEVIFTDDLYGARNFEISATESLRIDRETVSQEELPEMFSDIPIGRMPSPKKERSTELITKQLNTAISLHTDESRLVEDVGIYYDDDAENYADLDGAAMETRDLLSDPGLYNVSDFYSYYFPEEYPDMRIENSGTDFYDLVAGHDLVFYYVHGNGDRLSGYGPSDRLEEVTVDVDGEEQVKELDSYYVLTSSEGISENDFELNGQTIFCNSCFGASPFEKETPIYEEFFMHGAGSFIGNTGFAFGQGGENKPSTNAASRQILTETLTQVQAGNDLGTAVRNSKQKLLEKGISEDNLTTKDLHQLYGTVNYGDPTVKLEFGSSVENADAE